MSRFTNSHKRGRAVPSLLNTCNQNAFYSLLLSRSQQCPIPPEITFVTSEKMSGIGNAGGPLNEIEEWMHVLNATPPLANDILEGKYLAGLTMILDLLQEWKDVMIEAKKFIARMPVKKPEEYNDSELQEAGQLAMKSFKIKSKLAALPAAKYERESH